MKQPLEELGARRRRASAVGRAGAITDQDAQSQLAVPAWLHRLLTCGLSRGTGQFATHADVSRQVEHRWGTQGVVSA